MLASIASWYYIDQNFWDLVSVRMGFYTTSDLVIGGLLALVVLWFGAVKYPIIFAIVAFFIVHTLRQILPRNNVASRHISP